MKINGTVNSSGFIEVDITPTMLANATAKAQELGVLKNSIRKGQGNVVGFLGEEAVLYAFDGAESCNTYQHDIMWDGVTFEVKSKDRTVDPQPHYEASIANYNPNQRADCFVFVSIRRNKATGIYEKATITGIMEKSQYLDMATFLKVGDIDPSNGWRVSADCYNLGYQFLHRF